LLHDPRVFSFNVTPDVTARWVTLRGTVDNAKAKQAAERVARHTVGVHGVSNHLKVRTGEPLTEEEIKGNVELKLTMDPYVEAYEIDTDVNLGTVYLRGTVDSAFEKAQASSVAYGAMGVTKVKNLLEVSDSSSTARYDPYLYSYDPYPWDYYPYYPQTTFRNGNTVKTDAAIREDIEDELFWSPFVDLDEVNVQVDDGTARLTGEVDSLGEYEAATENALEGGAHEVDNDLVIR
jgi:osmotically-inducible protein OsmY